MFWALTMTSHLPPVSAGMIVSKKELTTSACRPSRDAMPSAISMSEPIGLPFASKYSCGGYGRSEQTSSLSAKSRFSGGMLATTPIEAGADAGADASTVAGALAGAEAGADATVDGAALCGATVPVGVVAAGAGVVAELPHATAITAMIVSAVIPNGRFQAHAPHE